MTLRLTLFNAHLSRPRLMKQALRDTLLPTAVLGGTALLAGVALVRIREPSIAAALATVALCIITGWYAWLTYRLVASNVRQTRIIERQANESQRARALIFAHLASRVEAAVRELPSDPGDREFDRRVREGVLWRPEELRELEQLGAYLGPWVAYPLIQIVNYLNWITARVGEVRAVLPHIGFDYSRLDSNKWKHAWGESTRQLPLIAKLARDVGEQLASHAGETEGPGDP